MRLNIEILKIVGPTDVPGKTYKELVVNYIVDGKAETKKLMSFNKDSKLVYDVVQTLRPGDLVNVEIVKNTKGYWDWIAVKYADPDEKGTPVMEEMKKTFPADPRETPEERAKKQETISRQWAVNAAVSCLKTDKNVVNVTQAIQYAEHFIHWLNKDPMQEILDMQDDALKVLEGKS